MNDEYDQPLAVLAELTFLRPDSPDSPSEPMPAWAWDRLSGALADESRERQSLVAAAVDAPAEPDVEDGVVVPIQSRHRSTYRWAGGLVAASLAVVVAGVVVTSMRTTSNSGSDAAVAAVAFTAAEAPAADAVATTAASGGAVTMAEAAPAPSAVVPSVASEESGTGIATKIGGDGWVQPARLVLASGTDYTPASLSNQVTGLLDGVGVDNADEARAMPVETALAAVGSTGFTTSIAALRECITALTQTTQSQALVVDRATYQGSDAGVVVAPTYDGLPSTSPAPTTTVTTDMGELDVWVVNPDCSVVDPSVMLHVLHHWAS